MMIVFEVAPAVERHTESNVNRGAAGAFFLKESKIKHHPNGIWTTANKMCPHHQLTRFTHKIGTSAGDNDKYAGM